MNLLKEILETGFRKVDRGTGDASYSLFGRQIRFDLSKGFPLLTTKKVFWKGVLHELCWFIKGDSNIKYLLDNGVHIWDDYPYKIYKKFCEDNILPVLSKDEFIEKITSDAKFSKKWGELPRIYGELWRKWPTRTEGRTIDQLKWAINEIVEDPNAHNCIVNSWNPEYLYTMASYEDACRFPICHNMFQINQIDGKLSLHLYQRSADIFLGVPFNIASYALLTIILARVTGYEVGDFVHTFGDVHIYENHLDQAKEQLIRIPKQLPTIQLNPALTTLEDFQPEHVQLLNYDPHPVLKAELSVSGGLFEGKPKTI
ncbi:thymidylate synthase [Candidatus Daviesbacteria bacterium RIFCSPLOWO2_02_FULL_40_8]|uniref:Thymidylate synthase n=1 Tax=Candidatus Daviesbacteria bacterium RIFCSPLOWO2_01_FULL_40_24 TaxID=1797787 RepID=A0A1F5MJS6_9BACT|nr:MAG: thymidylate synthase [Candidatus Daviesbacteria bacterium RIFCSPHIGHO2_01_FULL_41_45]OGE35514.1 MAG: thymidylate synthase [Candidatus Daviesbacteria bacterium RIFCSPHIGHO2_02_FULL_41_14]OGE65605.1 MAG: thymidylate synthase [Candidatus Daviesbacteria bacterium RIFCSPLOWO2_01_FULL_40_24]OGE66935.1 MAG: thymidylate synthase [Candidatus Daviesbacteria bacterium RIFCSPLOWO2_02_FULL_40_8]